MHETRTIVRGPILLCLIALLTAQSNTTTASDNQPAPELTLLQWNVENLFDYEDDPRNSGDDEFLPESWRRWSKGRYEIKLQNIASVIAAQNADIVCLQEIENRRVLKDLTGLLQERHGIDYNYIIHREGPDHRGVDIAIISKVKHVSARWITPIDGLRDVLIAHFRPANNDLFVFVNHWKSRWDGQEATEPKRCEQARMVHQEVTALLAVDENSAVMVVGDFNDNHTDRSLTEALHSTPDKSGLSGTGSATLYNLHGELTDPGTGSFYFHKEGIWNSFDQISISKSMLDPTSTPGWKIKPLSFKIVRMPEILTEDGTPKPFRPVREEESGTLSFIEGYSDHLPLHVTLQNRE